MAAPIRSNLTTASVPSIASGSVDIVSEFLRMREQFQVLHWQTSSYAEHKAFDWIFDELSGNIDKFMEIYLGAFGKGTIHGPFKITLLDYTATNATDFAQHCIDTINKVGMLIEGEDDLENVVYDMIGAFHKLKYLLTLK
jgi:hypothetical protein